MTTETTRDGAQLRPRTTFAISLAAFLAAAPLLADEEGSLKKRHHDPGMEKIGDLEELDAYGRGYELHMEGRYAEARAAFERSIEQGHDEAVALYNIACGYSLEGDHGKALELLERAVDAGFDDPRHLRADGDLAPLRRAEKARFEEIVRKAEAIEGKGERIAALARLDRLERSSDATAHDFHDVGTDLLQLRELPQATRALERATSLGGDEIPNAWYNLACAHALSGADDAAIDALAKAIEAGFGDDRHLAADDDLDGIRKHPRYAALEARTRLLSVDRFTNTERSREWPEAIKKLEEAAVAEPRSGAVWFSLAWGRHASGDWARAGESFAKAAELGYRTGVSHYNVACAEARQGHVDLAFAALERAESAGFKVKGRAWHDEDLSGLRRDPRFERYQSEKYGLRKLRGLVGQIL